MRKAIYFPAISAAPTSYYQNREELFKDSETVKKDIRFYADVDNYFYHPYTLWSAAHHYKIPDLRAVMGMDEKSFTFIDSGGYQLASGVISEKKWNNEIALQWSENNGDIFPILDRPLGGPALRQGNPEKQLESCLSLSLESANYYADNRSASGKNILNVISALNFEQAIAWYDVMKEVPLDGWAIGGGAKLRLITKIMIHLMLEGEFNRPKKTYVHLFGISAAPYMLYISRLQANLNKAGCDVQITYDSSTPFRKPAYREVYVGSTVTCFDLITLYSKHEETYKEMDVQYPFLSGSVMGDIKDLSKMFDVGCDFYILAALQNLQVILNHKEFVDKLTSFPVDEVVYQYLPARISSNIKALDRAFANPKKANAIIDRYFQDAEEKGEVTSSLDEFM